MFCWIHKELGFKHLRAYAQSRLIMCIFVLSPGNKTQGLQSVFPDTSLLNIFTLDKCTITGISKGNKAFSLCLSRSRSLMQLVSVNCIFFFFTLNQLYKQKSQKRASSFEPLPRSEFKLVWLSWGFLASLSLTLDVLDNCCHKACSQLPVLLQL